MRILFILLLALITLQVNAQKIIGSTTTAGGDLEGTYPNPRIKQNIINRANLTQSLRDSLTRFRHDTIIKHLVDGNINLGSIVNTLGKYNRVYILALGESGFSQGVIMPSGSDTIRNTEFYVTYVSEDTLSSCQIAAFNGFAVFYTPPVIDQSIVLRSLASGSTVMLKPMYVSGFWTWVTAVSKNIYGTFFDDATGITALTTDVVASGTGSVVATIQPNAVTTAKIADANVTLGKMATNSVNSAKIVDASVALADMASNSVDNTKIVDYSITGTDLNYLTLRAGDATNPLMRWTNGAVLTTPVNGTWEWDANKLNFTIGEVRKRLPVFNDAAPTGGQLIIGNGVDFTLANLTAGYAQTVTNGSGSITVNPDTTKVIPFIPSAEIANGTRDGYFRNQTNFGHQFYNGGFTIFNNSTASTSAATGHSITKGGSSSTISALMTSANVPYVQIGSNDGTAKSKVVTFDVNGITSQVYNTTLSANSQSSATYQVDGLNGIERITNGTVTTVTLPEIVASPSTNQVGVGFMFTLVINSSSSVTIQRAGSSDVIERHGIAGTNTSFSAATGTVHVYTCIATGSDTWAIK